jgi:hypothetical protein
MIDPLVVGGGKGIFPADGALRTLRLVDSKATSTGRDPRDLRAGQSLTSRPLARQAGSSR